jgi:hypothetical protein
MNKLILLFALLPALSYADSYFCPGNFQQIKLGDTLESVQQTCGKAANQNTIQQSVVAGPQTWTYYSQQSSLGFNNFQGPPPSNKVTLDFDGNGKVVNININGSSVGNTNLCGKTVQVGQSLAGVQSSCGKPVYVTPLTPPGSATPATQQNNITVLQYNSIPPMQLTFTNGKLTSVKKGS